MQLDIVAHLDERYFQVIILSTHPSVRHNENYNDLASFARALIILQNKGVHGMVGWSILLRFLDHIIILYLYIKLCDGVRVHSVLSLREMIITITNICSYLLLWTPHSLLILE